MTTSEETMAISDKLSKIKRQAAELNEKTAELNATIEHIEQGLLGSGVEFWWEDGALLGDREFRHSDAAGRELKRREFFILGYGKIGDVWCVAVQRWIGETADRGDDGEWDDVSDGDPVPLRRAPRRTRIEAAEHLEQFLDALSLEIDRMMAAIETANEIVRETPTTANAPAPTPPEYKGSSHANPCPRVSPPREPTGHASKK